MRKFAKALLCLNLFVTAGHAMAENQKTDVLLIGGGIMSATLGTYLQELQPDWHIDLYERMDHVAGESSNGWNNAGTGHSAFCELNYTPEKDDGTIDTSKAVKVNEAFEISRQFWSYQIRNQVLNNPRSFINNTPHMSFVWGDDRVDFLSGAGGGIGVVFPHFILCFFGEHGQLMVVGAQQAPASAAMQSVNSGREISRPP
ncbi:hypothetical protein WH50_19860 [Pokkaliibacter plantistimulans]|uniref:malate dehydrogenase (quinone) n=1 Tax=Pokkaliibacter plantistimulans TaxID=1635171 RepID=A0ABX5LVT8_9GAMM|nr:hypothetical protein WH50_19860 [Pokkaliibacter plantistimulans]